MKLLKGFPSRYKDAPEATGDDWWAHYRLALATVDSGGIVVMYGGLIIEEALVDDLYDAPHHPYTIGLLASLPHLDEGHNRKLTSIEGLPPVLYKKPVSCPFSDRCKMRVERCDKEMPSLRLIGNRHRVACWVNPETGKEY